MYSNKGKSTKSTFYLSKSTNKETKMYSNEVNVLCYIFVVSNPGVIDGTWSCWSAWTSSSQGRRSRSRSCSNPAPQNGGPHCKGESMETSEDEDPQLQYLKSESFCIGHCQKRRFTLNLHNILLFSHRTVEPQCFDQTDPGPQRCGTPPALINGYILVKMKIHQIYCHAQ